MTGELHRCKEACSELNLFMPCAAIMAHEEHRRGTTTAEIQRLFTRFWKRRAPLYAGDPGTTDAEAWRDIHGMMCLLHKHGAEALEIRNTRINWWPEGWHRGPPDNYYDAYNHPRRHYLWFVQQHTIPNWI